MSIAVKFDLNKHVTNVIRRNGRIISIDLRFKGANSTRIINIYINCNEQEKTKREKLLDELQILIKEAEIKQFQIIVMSDMNADPEIYDTKANLAIKGKYRIIQLLRNQNFNDTQSITNIGILTPT